MDTLINVRTFLSASRLGCFAGAARSLRIAPSVVSKRINQLEHEFKVALFRRSTRELALTVDGARLLPRFLDLVASFDELLEQGPADEIRGHIRVDAPGTLTTSMFGSIFCDFLALHPELEMDLRLIDRLDNPLAQGCDLAIGTRPTAYEHVNDELLMPYPCAAYASADYLAHQGTPQTPQDLIEHNCLVSRLFGSIWHFYGEVSDIVVTVRPRLSVNDGIVLRDAVRRGLGIAILPAFLAEDDVQSGIISPILPGYRPPPLWVKALVPAQKTGKPAVRALLDHLHTCLPVTKSRA